MEEKIQKTWKVGGKHRNRKIIDTKKPLTNQTAKHRNPKFFMKNKSHHRKLEPFPGGIDEKQLINHQFVQFSVKIKKAARQLKEFSYFRVKIRELVDQTRLENKNFINDETNQDSECNSHSLLIDHSHFKYKLIPELKTNKFFSFFEARNHFQNKPVNEPKNISVLSLKQLVEELYINKMINKSVYYRFLLHYSHNLQKNCIQKIEDNQQRINFRGCLFFLIDHRILAHTLTCKFPQKYEEVTNATTFSNSANSYLNEIYSLKIEDYFEELRRFNQIHDRFWMPDPLQIFRTEKILLKYQQNIQEINKMRSCGRILRIKY